MFTLVVTVAMVGVGPFAGAGGGAPFSSPSSVHPPLHLWVLLVLRDPGAARGWQGGRPQF